MNIADIKAYCKNPNIPHSPDKSYYKVLYQQCVKILEGLSESEVQYLIKNHPSLIHFRIADSADAKFTNEVFPVSPTSLSCGTFGTTRSSKKYIHLNLRDNQITFMMFDELDTPIEVVHSCGIKAHFLIEGASSFM